MPKRKRYSNDDGTSSKSRGKGVQEKLLQSRKLLHRALKTAKGFERQKLGKRLTLATKNNQTDDVARINREIEVLKGLDLSKVTDAHLHKTLLKVKAFAESELLPDEVKKVIPKPEAPEETLTAINNVTSGMCNTKPVKDIMQHIVSGIYVLMGITAPAKSKAKGIKKDVADVPIALQKDDVHMDEASEQNVEIDLEEESWSGLGSDEDKDEDEDKGNSGGDSLYEEELSRYDALLGASSDEESFDEEGYKAKRIIGPQTRLSVSPSPVPTKSPSLVQAKSLSPSPSPEPQARPQKVTKPKTAPTKGSTFLPTLIGGYWSGSESSASDLEDLKPVVRKNRRGQAARRAIAEKKFGEKAKHILSGQGPVEKLKDDGWDAKRGAKDSNDRQGRSRGFGRDAPQRGRNFERATGDNAIAVTPKPRGMGKKDDVGVLHPSWHAAKKAKEAKTNATFQGKKVTFD